MDASLLIIFLVVIFIARLGHHARRFLKLPRERHTRSAGDESDSRCFRDWLRVWSLLSVIMPAAGSSTLLVVVSASVGTPLILLPLSSRAIALGGGSDP
ncbi:hypothetical protein BC828DRAFT_392937, partial [Blastocladiella britannica]